MPGLSQARFCAEARNYAAKKRPDLQDGRATSAAIGLEGRGQEARSRKSDARSQELKANSYFPSPRIKAKGQRFSKTYPGEILVPRIEQEIAFARNQNAWDPEYR